MDVGRGDLTAPSGRGCFLQAGRGKEKQDREIEHMSERLLGPRGKRQREGLWASVIIAEEALDQPLQSALGT